MVLAGRSNRQPGVPSRTRKLSDDDVAELRRLIASVPMARPRDLKTQRKMAAHFGIHESVITGIKNGTRYRVPASELPPKPAPTRSRRKLTPRQAAEVKALSRAPQHERPEGLRLVREIASHYGISKSLVCRVRRGLLHDQVEPAALDSIQVDTHATAGEGQ
jgi:transposase